MTTTDSRAATGAQTVFPTGFRWGVATAGHQVEGDNVNSDVWFLEHLEGTIFAEPSGDAIDHYHRFADDIALIADLGFDTYRFSLEWARIEPEPGRFSSAAIEHYRRMMLACEANGVTPVVTFHHFVSPRWLLAAGGWEDAGTPDRFARYCDVVTERLGEHLGAAFTLNEPNLPFLLSAMGVVDGSPEARAHAPMWVAAGKALGIDPRRVAPFQFTASQEGYATKLAAHHAGRDAIKAHRPDLLVGWTLANSDIQAVPGGEGRADAVREAVNERFLLDTRGDDVVGIQTYGRTVFDADGLAPAPEDAVVNTMGEEIYPRGIETTVREAWRIAQVPVWVTENGLATDDDTQRVAYFDAAVSAVAECLADGIDVRGYTAWSAFDNFEWVFGYRPHFGLIEVDRATQQRTPKPSAYRLGEIARTNGAALQG